MNKRGLSNVIVTLILIVISLIAVGLVWVAVQNLIESETEQISLGFITVDLEIKDVEVKANDVEVKVKRNIGEGEITGLKFIVSDGVNTETIDKENVNLDELEEKTFTITSGELGEVAFVKEISVAPVFKLESGKEKIGNVVDEFEFNSKKVVENLGPISWWRFDGDARDEIGENHGTLNGGMGCGVQGKYGEACEFDGVDDKIAIPTTGSFETIHGPSTLSLWFKPISLVGNRYLFSDNCYEWGMRHVGSTIFGRAYTAANGGIIQSGEWYNAVLTHSHPSGLTNTEIKFYINGKLKEEKILSIATQNGYNGDVPYWVGADGCNSNNEFNGIIDEVMIFNKALSDKEVEALYNLDLS